MDVRRSAPQRLLLVLLDETFDRVLGLIGALVDLVLELGASLLVDDLRQLVERAFMLFGFRVAWIIPLYKRMPKEYYYN